MNKGYLLATGLLLLVLTNASAEIYRCRTADGRLIMTDNRSNLPAGCVPLDQPAGTGSFNVVPAPSVSASASQATPSETPGTKPAEPQAAGQASLYEQAQLLVQNYNDAVTRRYHAGRVTEQQAAMREISELRRQKEGLLNSLARSGLNQEERQSVRRLLDRVPRR